MDTRVALRAEERAAIDVLIAELSRARGTTYEEIPRPYCPVPDRPDLIVEERPSKRRIGIEHTRLPAADLASIDAWSRFYDEVKKCACGLPGTFLIGPAGLDMRFALPRGTGRHTAAERVLQCIRSHNWEAQASATISVANTADAPQVKVLMIDKAGSEVVGLPVLGHVPWPDLLRLLGERVTHKAEDLGTLEGVDERILLLDLTLVSPLEVGPVEEHLYDDIWWLQGQGSLSLDYVYCVCIPDGDRVQALHTRMIWPRP
jgi:hypothetical protein